MIKRLVFIPVIIMAQSAMLNGQQVENLIESYQTQSPQNLNIYNDEQLKFIGNSRDNSDGIYKPSQNTFSRSTVSNFEFQYKNDDDSTFRNGYFYLNCNNSDTERENVTNTFSISCKAGLKLAESLKLPGTNEGMAIGMGLKIHLDESWFLLPGIVYWGAEPKNNINRNDFINTYSINLLCGYIIRIKDYSFSLGFGAGSFKSNKSTKRIPELFGESNFSLKLNNKTILFFELSYRHAASLDVGGSGLAYNPFIFSIGIEIIT